ncbi:MAG: hypothetical protein SO152_04390 [Ruminococcus sp.]|nr:hypothetical protein [Ruminococcus sp.]
MLDVDITVKNHIINNLLENILEISFPWQSEGNEIAPITMKNIVEESMTLKQSICSESKLKFGGCIASEFSISLCDDEERSFAEKDLKGKWILVKLTQKYLGNNIYPGENIYPTTNLFPGQQIQTKEFFLFNGYIDSLKYSSGDKHKFDLVAYDYFGKLNTKDGTNELLTQWGNATFRPLGTMLRIFINNIHSTNVSPITGLLSSTFVAGGTTKTKIYDFPTMNSYWLTNKDKTTYGEVARYLCEMVGCFGYIMPNTDNKEGNFVLAYLDFSDKYETYGFYEELNFEDFKTNGYSGLSWTYGGEQKKSSKEKISKFFPNIVPDSATKNIYDMTDNICCWQQEISSGENFHILDDFYNTSNVFNRFYNSGYIPFTAKVDGRPWVQVGDNVQFNVYETDVNGEPVLDNNGNQKITTVNSVVLSRTLSGIQALTDTLETKGEM